MSRIYEMKPTQRHTHHLGIKNRAIRQARMRNQIAGKGAVRRAMDFDQQVVLRGVVLERGHGEQQRAAYIRRQS